MSFDRNTDNITFAINGLDDLGRPGVIAQVAGRKRYRLIPAAQWHRVHNREGVFSEVDAARPDLDRYPEFRDATVLDFVLEPGEVLFMPVGWWHHVLALDVSISVSFTRFEFPNHFTWEQA